MRDAGLRGNVGEGAVAIIAKEMRSRLASGWKAFQPRSIHKKNIEPAVVVVIVKSYAATRGFEEIFIFVLAAKNCFRIQSGLTPDIDEAHAQIGSLGRSFALRGSC